MSRRSCLGCSRMCQLLFSFQEGGTFCRIKAMCIRSEFLLGFPYSILVLMNSEKTCGIEDLGC